MKKLLIAILTLATMFTCVVVGLCVVSNIKEKFDDTTNVLTQKFSNLIVETSNENIHFLPADSEEIKVNYKQSKDIKFDVKVEDDTLKVIRIDTRNILKKLIQQVEIDFDIVVYLPTSILGNVSVKTVSGKVNLDEGLNFNSLSLIAESGNITCMSNAIGDVVVQTKSGSIVCGNQKANIYNVKSVNGRIKIANVNAKDLNIENVSEIIALDNVLCNNVVTMKTVSGNISFNNFDAKVISVTNDSGGIEGSIKTSKIFNIKSKTGKINVPENDANGGEFNIDTISSNIRISLA